MYAPKLGIEKPGERVGWEVATASDITILWVYSKGKSIKHSIVSNGIICHEGAQELRTIAT